MLLLASGKFHPYTTWVDWAIHNSRVNIKYFTPTLSDRKGRDDNPICRSGQYSEKLSVWILYALQRAEICKQTERREEQCGGSKTQQRSSEEVGEKDKQQEEEKSSDKQREREGDQILDEGFPAKSIMMKLSFAADLCFLKVCWLDGYCVKGQNIFL